MSKIKVICVGGTRPNFVKLAPLVRAFDAQQDFECFFLHSGQHRHPTLDQQILYDLQLREPDVRLASTELVGKERLAWFEQELAAIYDKERAVCIFVVGDVDTSLAAARAAAKTSAVMFHVEAGLRSFEATLPEERNRIEIDHLADVLYTTEIAATQNLKNEGIEPASICFVGNVMIDSLKDVSSRLPSLPAILKSRYINIDANYGIATLHRGGNVDEDDQLSAWIEFLNRLSIKVPIIWPTHPRISARRIVRPKCIDWR
jgi:UDP-N-acetylglucosamine 2-epimerase (non-hydrolysing)